MFSKGLGKDFLYKLSAKAANIFPATASVQHEIEDKLYDLLQSSFNKLNLVTREEFDSQLAVLTRAQLSISQLEKRLAELEQLQQEPQNKVQEDTVTNTDQISDN